ncbi:FG-GAP and VCBS repeat-containing protein [Streptomyces sp. WI04-05B]|uniref:FG-GAP and VCBS repeat-containing protein n=1 Tax=Streptomyces TaxID=1883 RepID=UPI0029A62212|nr:MULTISPECIES: FG-GAP and VCBS repeat-containing protein [unclassified Streptomyces]MDX2543211.1 FG-GAP and VCBS repeat-containing protein [Streptomyces sp. WI04-05B]MDX2584748.1 FG-GAP and VCBS repeat-containing protein [Streptomyces sp. WI04-05A]MDX3752745.1 FG-GAP and VCBS repeat-containing protein [Streptomyces sp. AK08-02]
MRSRATLLATALLAATLSPLTLGAPASAAPAKHVDDFNGDGYRDLLLGDRTATVAGKRNAGAVVVIWGSATGLNPARRSVITQNSPGIDGGAEANDGFGAKVTSADLNKDGYADVVAGSPGELHADRHGTLTVLWGSRSGLTKGSIYASPGSKAEPFGLDAAIGDFDADGQLDIVSVDGDFVWFLRGPFTKAGGRGKATNLDPWDGENIKSELVVAGKVTKDGTADFALIGYDLDTSSNRVWFYKGGRNGPAKPWKRTLPASPDLSGSSAVIADFDRNGYGDLAIGVSRSGRGGTVRVLPGTATGPSGRLLALTQNTPGVPGSVEDNDLFGYDVSAADTNGDGYPDLAVGAPSESIDANGWANGSITVLRGGSTGLTGRNARQYDRTTPGLPNVSPENGWLGASLLLRDFNGDGRAELIATANEGGRLHLLPGTSAGPTGTGSRTLTVPQLGLGARAFMGAELTD